MSRLLLLALSVSACLAESTRFRIDSAHSAAMFSVRHMMVSNVRGQMGRITGTVDWDPADPAKTRIEASVDVAGLNTREERRDNHLRSADFFDAAKFPAITFVSKHAQAAGAGRLKITGDLTMRGVTKEVVLDVEGPTPPLKDQRGVRVGAAASAKINRKDFNVLWNRAVDGGGVVVGDEVSITLDVELVSAN